MCPEVLATVLHCNWCYLVVGQLESPQAEQPSSSKFPFRVSASSARQLPLQFSPGEARGVSLSSAAAPPHVVAHRGVHFVMFPFIWWWSDGRSNGTEGGTEGGMEGFFFIEAAASSSSASWRLSRTSGFFDVSIAWRWRSSSSYATDPIQKRHLGESGRERIRRRK